MRVDGSGRTRRWLTVVLVGLLVVPLLAAGPHEDASSYSEYYFPSSDGINTLHADVLRPAGVAADEPTPVVLTVSPYVNHSGSLPIPPYYDPAAEGPNGRFYDFLDLSGALEQGYTYVMVDLPGFGGSSGCNDWGGIREQTAVKDAVEWAASQEWSTGRVAMLGKSYDAWTGLMGIDERPRGLAAVVSMEPVYSGYRYLYNNGVRFLNSVLTPAIFQAVDAQPGSLTDDARYHANGAPQAWCYGLNVALQQQDDPDANFWVARDLLRTTAGLDTPLFLTQGFLETNTKPDAAFDYFNGLDGDDNRAWFGQFDHVRGWEKTDDGTRYHTGRDTFVTEVMRFLDEHLKGIEPDVEHPAVAVQDNLGRYRGEANWPPTDSQTYQTALRVGTYTDDGRGPDTSTKGLWSISAPLPYDVWLAGEPTVTASVAGAPRANIVANLYDIGPDGTATVVSRGTRLVREGTGKASFELYGQDWVLQAGHRIGVRITDANSDWWSHVGTQAPVAVTEATATLPFLTYQRSQFLEGGSTPRLEQHLASQTVALSDELIASSQTDFALPRPLTNPPDGNDGPPPGPPDDPGCSNRPAAARGGPARCVP